MEKKKKKLFPLALGEEAESREQRGLMILVSASGMLHLHSQLLLFSLTCSLFPSLPLALCSSSHTSLSLSVSLLFLRWLALLVAPLPTRAELCRVCAILLVLFATTTRLMQRDLKP